MSEKTPFILQQFECGIRKPTAWRSVESRSPAEKYVGVVAPTSAADTEMSEVAKEPKMPDRPDDVGNAFLKE